MGLHGLKSLLELILPSRRDQPDHVGHIRPFALCAVFATRDLELTDEDLRAVAGQRSEQRQGISEEPPLADWSGVHVLAEK